MPSRLRLRAFLRAHLCCSGLGGLALLPLGSLPGPGPVPALIAQEDEMCSFEMSDPGGSHAGKKEIGQKS